MLLNALLNEINYEIVLDKNNSFENAQIETLVYDSRKVDDKSVFVCIKGAVSDGHMFLEDVLSKNAVAIIVSKEYMNSEHKMDFSNANSIIIEVEDTRFALANMSVAFFGYPSKKLKTIGITGTKGKTTTTYMIRSMLENAGIKTGLIGTIETIIGDESIKSANTTPESYVLQEYFAKMVEAGCKAVVMEVSSQGLKYNRVTGFEFDYGLFSNMGVDHIGPNEHDDFEDYLESKSKLFKQCKIGIVNADDKYLDDILKNHTCEVETFGLTSKADLTANNINLTNKGGELGINYDVTGLMNFNVDVNIPGKFSVYNSLMAISLGRHFNLSVDDIKNAMCKLHVKGRVERVKTDRDDYSVIIDYAHNAMSVESLLTAMKEYNPKRIVCVFGCGGNRDRNRRYDMGEIAGKMADLSILTTDNPRMEEPEAIIDDIIVGTNKSNGKYEIILDRAKAIEYALDNALEGDIILLLGKGHEYYQEIRGVKHHFDEREVIAEHVKKKLSLDVNEVTALELAKLCGGKVIAGDEKYLINQMVTDSRNVKNNTLFVAIKGERVDGHNYVMQVLDNKSAALVSQKPSEDVINKANEENIPVIMVDDTIEAMQDIGVGIRNRYSKPIVSITGSVGKTTTKEMISLGLSTRNNVLKTEGNLNSQIGVAIMMSRLKNQYDTAVIEMGISERNEMERLSRMAKPSVCVITNIGVSHIQQLGSKENIMAEKANIIDYFRDGEEDKVLIVNGDDEELKKLIDYKNGKIELPCLDEMTKKALKKTRIVTFGFNSKLDYYAENSASINGEQRFTLVHAGGRLDCKLNVLGNHNVYNAMAAVAVGNEYGISAETVMEGLIEYQPLKMRGTIVEANGYKVIDDTYNASPDSMISGIEVLVGLEGVDRRLAVLADVLELGEQSDKLHYQVGEYIVNRSKNTMSKCSKPVIDTLVCVGDKSMNIGKAVEADEEVSRAILVKYYKTNEETSAYLKSVLGKNDAVLVKGSRGMHMDEVVDAITK